MNWDSEENHRRAVRFLKTFALRAHVSQRNSDSRMSSNYKEDDDSSYRAHGFSSCPIICYFVRSVVALLSLSTFLACL